MAIGNIVYSTSSSTITAGDVIDASDFERSTKLQVDDVSGNLIVTGGIITGGVSNLTSNSNVKISGGSSGQVLSTDGSGNLSWTSSVNQGTVFYASNLPYVKSINFNVPSWVKRISMSLEDLRIGGIDNLTMKIATAGGTDAVSYRSGAMNAGTGFNFTNSSVDFILFPDNTNSASTDHYGIINLEKIQSDSWVYTSTIYHSSPKNLVSTAAGSAGLGAAIGIVRLTTRSGLFDFIAGRVNILYS